METTLDKLYMAICSSNGVHTILDISRDIDTLVVCTFLCDQISKGIPCAGIPIESDDYWVYSTRL